MKGEIICNNETITRKKKKKSQKQSKDILVDKLSNTEAGSECEHVKEAVSDVPESSKKKKQKRKHKDVDEECSMETDGKRKSKEKYSHDNVHKKQKTGDNELTTQSSCDTSPDNEKIKQKMKRNEEKAALTQASCENDEPQKKKKKSKGESVASDIVLDNQGAQLEEVKTVLGDGKQKKRKKKHNVDLHLDNDVETKDVAKHKNLSNTCVEESTDHHKKKKKHSKHEDTLSKDESESKVHKNKHKNKTIASDNTAKNNESGHGSKKHKASKKHKSEKHLDTSVETQDKINIADQQILSSICEEEDGTHRKKNKKHKHKEASSVDESEHTQNNATCSGDNSRGNISAKVHSDNKKSVPKCVVAENGASCVSSKQNNLNCSEDETVQHHKDHKKHLKTKDSPETNHLTVSKSSPSDQSHSMKSESSSVAVQGQWQGNLFESTERQNKFMRLLGGMKKPSSGSTEVAKKDANGPAGSSKKKGLFGSLTSMVSTLSPHNAAMSSTAAASLNQKLEDEYNKAMNFKLSGKVGTGFGFAPDPAEGKKFHIDINKSKSVKFDD